MSSIYSNADLRFQEKLGADKLEETRQNNIVGQPLTINQTTVFLQISRKQIYRLFDQKLLRSFHIGRRRFVSMNAINDFIKEREESE